MNIPTTKYNVLQITGIQKEKHEQTKNNKYSEKPREISLKYRVKKKLKKERIKSYQTISYLSSSPKMKIWKVTNVESSNHFTNTNKKEATFWRK